MNRKDVERARGILAEKKEEFNELMESCEFPLPMREVGTFVEALGVAIACMEMQVGKKPVNADTYLNGRKYYIVKCPVCSMIVNSYPTYCDCGQRILWEVEDGE